MNFTVDWSELRQYWPELPCMQQLHDRVPNPRMLEIGCFEGLTTLWLLGSFPGSTVTVVDTFTGSSEWDAMRYDDPADGLMSRFLENIEDERDRVNILRGRSSDVLRTPEFQTGEQFDFIYIDGSHEAKDVLEDAILAWPLLKHAGIMIFDDYGWALPVFDYKKPQLAVKAFVSCYEPELFIAHCEYQCVVVKR